MCTSNIIKLIEGEEFIYKLILNLDYHKIPSYKIQPKKEEGLYIFKVKHNNTINKLNVETTLTFKM